MMHARRTRINTLIFLFRLYLDLLNRSKQQSIKRRPHTNSEYYMNAMHKKAVFCFFSENPHSKYFVRLKKNC